MISVVHPSRGRAEKAKVCYDEWKSKAVEDFEYILVIDKDDAIFQDYYDLFPKECIYVSDSKNVVEAMNFGASKATGDILVCISDDFGCPDNWDKYIKKHIEADKEQLLLVSDGHGAHIMATIPIITKKLYDRLGYVYHPETTGMYADNILAEYCEAHGLLKINREETFLHKHWLYGHYKADDTNKRHDNPEGWAKGKAVIERLRKENYGA